MSAEAVQNHLICVAIFFCLERGNGSINASYKFGLEINGDFENGDCAA